MCVRILLMLYPILQSHMVGIVSIYVPILSWLWLVSLWLTILGWINYVCLTIFLSQLINLDWLWLTTIHLSQARLLAAAAATVTMPCCAKGTERLERAAPSGAQRPSWHHRGSRSPGAGCCVEETKDIYIIYINYLYVFIYL